MNDLTIVQLQTHVHSDKMKNIEMIEPQVTIRSRLNDETRNALNELAEHILKRK